MTQFELLLNYSLPFVSLSLFFSYNLHLQETETCASFCVGSIPATYGSLRQIKTLEAGLCLLICFGGLNWFRTAHALTFRIKLLVPVSCPGPCQL